MISQTSALDNFKLFCGNGYVIVGNDDSSNISHIGSNKLSKDMYLLDALVVPHITKYLISISKLTSNYPIVLSSLIDFLQCRIVSQSKLWLRESVRRGYIFLIDGCSY